ncbi:MAG: lycopene cyclase [Bacteroidales bacterium]|nr:lycopene cyclase [Bacteroidales bacterium]
MKTYDFIIAGGGASGLSLAYYLSLSSLSNSNVLIIDKDRKNKNDRTWGFWTNQKTAFDPIVHLKFDKLEFHSSTFSKSFDLADYRYNVIRGIDFYQMIKNHLVDFPNVEFLNASITGFQEETEGAIVHTDLGNFKAKWVFSSIFDEKEIVEAAKSKLYLRQHFKGWFVRSDKPVFDTNTFRMFDFRTPQHGLMRFFYVIPSSPTEALVEYTLFSEHLLEKPLYDEAIRHYLADVLNITNYTIQEEEFGVIPMTNYVFPVTRGKHIVQIGSAGGSSKPSSGYTFLRILKHTQKIAQALEEGRSPVISANSSSRYRFFDSVLLNILKNEGYRSERIFTILFKNNTIRHIFNFLDEEGGLANDLKIITSLPPWPFLKSTVDIIRCQKI